MRPDLNQLVHTLTRTHKTSVTRDDGTTQYVENMSLLNQLRTLINVNRGTGAGASSLVRVPLSLDAVQLWDEISRASSGFGPYPVPRRIQRWLVWANSQGQDERDELEHRVSGWITRIESMAVPTVNLDAPCPVCGEKWVRTTDGYETTRVHALSYNQYRAGCKACQASWEGKGAMVSLANQLHQDQSDTPPTPEPVMSCGTMEVPRVRSAQRVG